MARKASSPAPTCLGHSKQSDERRAWRSAPWPGAMLVADEYEYGIDAPTPAPSIAENIPAGAGLLLLIEHRWALGLKRAIRGAGGIVLAQDMLSQKPW
jgi:hypothetical protein